jgi:hypothetical protein
MKELHLCICLPLPTNLLLMARDLAVAPCSRTLVHIRSTYEPFHLQAVTLVVALASSSTASCNSSVGAAILRMRREVRRAVTCRAQRVSLNFRSLH